MLARTSKENRGYHFTGIFLGNWRKGRKRRKNSKKKKKETRGKNEKPKKKVGKVNTKIER